MISIRIASFLFVIVSLSLPALGSSGGPFLGSNGIPGGTTCDTAGCHTGAPPADAEQGSVRIVGLPAQWTPNATYNLQVIVQRPSARRFGFQLSAIFSDTRIAGTFSSEDSRISIITGFSLSTRFVGQYAQHNDAPYASAEWTFPVSWRAPSSAASGDVTFYIAGNAANGNNANNGDAIYLTTVQVSPAITSTNSRAYAAVNLGAVSFNSSGLAISVDVGYARVVPNTGSTTPAGSAIFGYRSNNILISETSVAASPPIRSGRVFAEVNADFTVNTGIAIANPNSQPAAVSYFFTNAAGADLGNGSFNIPANGQIARFLNEAPFNAAANFQGTFTLTADIPVAVTALRGLTNERSEFLLTTLPVTDLSGPSPSGTQLLAHYADGGGWTTQIVLVNTTAAVIGGSIEFVNSDGALASRVPYSVARHSSQRLVTSGTAPLTSTGSIRIVPDGENAPVAFDIFSFRQSGITLSSAGVPAVNGNAFRMYSENSGVVGSAGSIRTGVAIANASATAASVRLELYRSDGTAVAAPAVLTIPAAGQLTRFVSEIFPGLATPFQGVLRIVSSSLLTVAGIRGRYNERSDFLITTTPPSIETATPSTTEVFFPHLADGGGYTTQFILVNGSSNQTATGVVRFLKQDGSALNLTVN